MKVTVTKSHIDESVDAHGSLEIALHELFNSLWRVGNMTIMNLSTGEWGYHTPEIQEFLRHPRPFTFELPKLQPE